MRDWLSRIDKDSKEARNKKIFEMWMACHTQEEIGEVCGCDQKTVANTVSGKEFQETIFLKPEANHQSDFDIPLYNVWKFKEKSNETAHFGNTEVTIVDNLPVFCPSFALSL